MHDLYQLTEENKIAEGVYKTRINGLYFIKSSFFPDDRGFFRGVGLLPDINAAIGQEFIVKQINHSRSMQHVVRGMHAENWNKFVTVCSGTAFCALADVRPSSSTFRVVECFQLGYGNESLQGALYISRGIANSLCVVEGPVDYLYFFDELYRDRDPKGDKAISLFDPDLNIQWPINKEEMIISQRDRESITLRELYPNSFK